MSFSPHTGSNRQWLFTRIKIWVLRGTFVQTWEIVILGLELRNQEKNCIHRHMFIYIVLFHNSVSGSETSFIHSNKIHWGSRDVPGPISRGQRSNNEQEAKILALVPLTFLVGGDRQ